jgi:adenylate cyclase
MGKGAPYKDPEDRNRLISALRKAGLPDKPPLPLPDKPSIAVLAFDNLSGDPEQVYFADGLSEEIITALSSVPKLFVIARNSSFIYKGKPVKVQQVSRELGVRYVLEGSVRKAEDRVRITAQLIDALKGHHLWAESYDRKLEDIFVLQDEITMKIITELQVLLTDGERTRIGTPCSGNLKAYLKYLQASDYYRHLNKQNIDIAQRLGEEAVALDPEYACAYSLLGAVHIEKLRQGLTTSPEESMATAYKMTSKAISLNPSLPGPRAILSLMYRTMGQLEKAIAEAEKALSFSPNSALANIAMGNALRSDGRSEEGLPFLQQATRIDPFNPIGLSTLGFSYILTGQYEEGIRTCKKAADLSPENIYVQLCLASAHSATGREETARVAAAEVLKINPRFSAEYFLKSQKFKKKEDNEFLIDTFRKAGLPE